MSFFEVLHKFKNKIINDVCENEHPENLLTKKHIANSFLKFVSDLGIDENDTYYLSLYEEEHNKNSTLSQTDFIYYTILGIENKMDISEEYLRLYNELSEYKSVLQDKKSKFEEELRTISDNYQRNKIIYYKREIDKMIEGSKCFTTKYLIEKAWTYCTALNYMRYYNGSFLRNIYSAQNIEADRRNIIFFGDLSLVQFEKIIALKKEDPIKYSENFEEIIYSLDIGDRLPKIVENNFFMHDRLSIISVATTLFKEKQYDAFVYLITPQIEGLFKILLHSIKGDGKSTSGMKELIERIQKHEDFFEFVYFAYEFPDLRNKIAHGEMITVDRELACEVMMDLYWIIKKIDDEKQDYKKLLIFLDDFCSKRDLEMKLDYLANYFNSIECEKKFNLLERYFNGEFETILKWYRFNEQVNKFHETICSEGFYLLIWNEEEPLKLIKQEKLKIEGGKIIECNIEELNDDSLKYYKLLLLLNKYNYIPKDWYKKYLSFTDKIETERKNILQKIGIDSNEIEKELEEIHQK